MTDYVAPMIVPAVPAEEESAALAASPEPAAVTATVLAASAAFMAPAGPEMRECLMCGGAGPAESMFDAGYGWFCPTTDYAGCRRRQGTKIVAARSFEIAAEPRREAPRKRPSRRKSPAPEIVAGTTADEASPVAPAATKGSA